MCYAYRFSLYDAFRCHRHHKVEGDPAAQGGLSENEETIEEDVQEQKQTLQPPTERSEESRTPWSAIEGGASGLSHSDRDNA